MKKELKLFKNKSKSLRAVTIKKNLKKDLPNLKEVSESLKSEEEVKLKSAKSKIESLMLFAQLKPLCPKVSFPEEEQHYYMPQNRWINF